MPLRFKLQFVVVADHGSETTEDVVVLDKDHERLDQLGLTLAEGKQLLREVQRRVLERQVTAFLSVETACPKCGRQRGTRDHKVLGLRTLFGKMTLQSARLRRCCPEPGESASVSPLKWRKHPPNRTDAHVALTVAAGDRLGRLAAHAGSVPARFAAIGVRVRENS
jgi:hypothetical protein